MHTSIYTFKRTCTYIYTYRARERERERERGDPSLICATKVTPAPLEHKPLLSPTLAQPLARQNALSSSPLRVQICRSLSCDGPCDWGLVWILGLSFEGFEHNIGFGTASRTERPLIVLLELYYNIPQISNLMLQATELNRTLYPLRSYLWLINPYRKPCLGFRVYRAQAD